MKTPADTLAELTQAGAAVYWRGQLFPIVHAELFTTLLFFIAFPAEDQKDCHGVPFDEFRITGGEQYLEFMKGGELVAVVAAAANWPEIDTDTFNSGMAAWRSDHADGPAAKAWREFVAGQRECFAPS